MNMIKCSVCGGALVGEGAQRKCKYCGAQFLVADPQMQDELAQANAFRECTRFDEAAALYRGIIKKYKGQDFSDVYWGLLLCEQRVMFETDEKGERFPSFYAITDDEIEDSPYYMSALQMAQKNVPEKVAVFEEMAGKMARAKKLYERISASAKPYDIFICFKKTAKGGGVTKDTALALDLYNQFAKDYRIFFSERSLRDVTVREFEPNIYYALYSAKVLLLLCSKKEYIESQWVRNEWSRFLQFSLNPSAGKVIIPIFLEDFKPSQLPAVLSSMQGLKDDRMLFSTLEKTLKNIVKPVDVEAEMLARDRKWEQMLAEQQRATEERQKAAEEQQKALLEKLAALESEKEADEQRSSAQRAQEDERLAKLFEEQRRQSEEQQRKAEEQQKALLEKIAALEKQKAAEKQSAGMSSDRADEIAKLIEQQRRQTEEQQRKAEEQQKALLEKLAALENAAPASGVPVGNPNFVIKDGKLVQYKGKSENVAIPDGIHTIGRGAFDTCNTMKTVSVPSCVLHIETNAFRNCAELQSILLGVGVNDIQIYAFTGLPSLESITVEQGNKTYHSVGECLIKTERKSLVLGCKKSVIPADGSVTRIGNGAFYNNTALTLIEIPRTVTEIGTEAFFGCKALKDAIFRGKKKEWEQVKIERGNNSTLGSITVRCQLPPSPLSDFKIDSKGVLKNYLGKDKDVVIPEGVTEIDINAFGSFKQLDSVELPSTLTKIGKWAFRGSDLPGTVVIPAGVTSIGEAAFEQCHMEEIIFEEGSQLKWLSASVFKNCKRLKRIKFPASLTSFGKECFYNCTALTEVILDNPAAWKGYDSPFSYIAQKIPENLADPAQAAKAMKTHWLTHWRR